MAILALDIIHAQLESVLSALIWRSGIDHETPPALPYIQYTKITENRLKDYQILKEYSEDTPLTPEIEYKNSVSSLYEYATVNDSKGVENAMNLIRDLFNYLTTDEYRLFMNRNNIHYTIMSDITEIITTKASFTERWFKFTVRYTHADIYKRAEGGFIESATATMTEPPPAP